MKLRRSHTEKLVAGLERAVERDIKGGGQQGWLLRRHRDHLRAVSILVSPDYVTVELRPNGDFMSEMRAEC